MASGAAERRRRCGRSGRRARCWTRRAAIGSCCWWWRSSRSARISTRGTGVTRSGRWWRRRRASGSSGARGRCTSSRAAAGPRRVPPGPTSGSRPARSPTCASGGSAGRSARWSCPGAGATSTRGCNGAWRDRTPAAARRDGRSVTMTQKEVLDELKELVVERLKFDPRRAADMTLETTLPKGVEGSLGLDSLDFIELSVALEERFGIVIDEGRDLTEEFLSLDSLSRFILAKTGQG